MVQYNPMINAGPRCPCGVRLRIKIGRGGTLIFKFDYDTAKKVCRPLPTAEVTEKEVWDNLTYSLKSCNTGGRESRCEDVPAPLRPAVPNLAGIARVSIMSQPTTVFLKLCRKKRMYDLLSEHIRADAG